jgi:hypothetical protein
MPERNEKPDVNHGRSLSGDLRGSGPVVTRREFVMKLATGAGAGVVVLGLLAGEIPKLTAGSENGSEGSPRPHLRDDVVFGLDGDMPTIHRAGETDSVVCAINRPGAVVLEHLDGRHTVEEISEFVAARLDVSRNELLDSQIAGFIVQLSMLGFLREPFYAYIIERTVA